MIFNEEEYKTLNEALARTEAVSLGRPDMFQYFQNELSKTIARLILAPFYQQQKELHEKANPPAAPADAPVAAE